MIHALSDSRIKVLSSGLKLGPYAGLNFLLDHAQGSYIAIQDHDDLRHPEKISKQISFLENHHEFVGCGTKTLMRYEGDNKGFEYYLGKENFYTIHPSLVFRNTDKRYDPEKIYMCDALFQKKTLCHGEKKIANLDETLTMHRIKAGSKNFSYKWFTFTRVTINTLFSLHPWWYAMCALLWEGLRKIIYPMLHRANKGYLIDKIERVPFVLMGNQHFTYNNQSLFLMGFKNLSG